jgi:ribosomal protein S18 acetylase RimI-like enzyme
MITFGSLSDLSLREIVELANQGFEDYLVPIKWSEMEFVRHLANGHVSPELSVVAYLRDKPIGFVLTSIRQIDGQKVAWNAGTGVIKEWRDKGVGRRLMEKVLEVYQKEKVAVATLEAFSANRRAIALYEKIGYRKEAKLFFYRLAHRQRFACRIGKKDSPFHLKRGSSRNVAELSFFRSWVPWQNQLPSLADAESVILYDRGKPVGYALYRSNEQRICLYHCEAAPDQENKPIYLGLLKAVYGTGLHNKSCTTFNLQVTQGLEELLLEAGFEPTPSQVWMVKKL